jgi:antitoxin component YwqK of YwqJK toxin-antitoxin module
MKWMLAVVFWGLSWGVFAQDTLQNTKKQKRKTQSDSLLKSLVTPPSLGATVAGKEITAGAAKDFFTEKLPDLGLKIKEARKREKERRRKKKLLHTEYEGLGIVKMVTSMGSGDRLTQIEFHVLKEFKQPSLYVPDPYWYDTRNRIVSKSAMKDKESALILHGPYKRYVAGNLIEEGNYYVGNKDGRWEMYDADFRLLDKSKWRRGFPAESVVSYYDSAHTKIKEVIPVQFGKRQGDYYKFYEGGQLMVKGQYDNDLPVKTWTEYYQFKRQRKKITQYPARWFDEAEPVVLSEWDDKGKLIYERPKDKNTAADDADN